MIQVCAHTCTSHLGAGLLSGLKAEQASLQNMDMIELSLF